MKKILSLVLALILSFSCLTTVVASAENVPDTSYSSNITSCANDEYYDESDDALDSVYRDFGFLGGRTELNMDAMDVFVEITLIPFKVVTFPFIFLAGFIAGLLGL